MLGIYSSGSFFLRLFGWSPYVHSLFWDRHRWQGPPWGFRSHLTFNFWHCWHGLLRFEELELWLPPETEFGERACPFGEVEAVSATIILGIQNMYVTQRWSRTLSEWSYDVGIVIRICYSTRRFLNCQRGLKRCCDWNLNMWCIIFCVWWCGLVHETPGLRNAILDSTQ